MVTLSSTGLSNSQSNFEKNQKFIHSRLLHGNALFCTNGITNMRTTEKLLVGKIDGLMKLDGIIKKNCQSDKKKSLIKQKILLK